MKRRGFLVVIRSLSDYLCCGCVHSACIADRVASIDIDRVVEFTPIRARITLTRIPVHRDSTCRPWLLRWRPVGGAVYHYPLYLATMATYLLWTLYYSTPCNLTHHINTHSLKKVVSTASLYPYEGVILLVASYVSKSLDPQITVHKVSTSLALNKMGWHRYAPLH